MLVVMAWLLLADMTVHIAMGIVLMAINLGGGKTYTTSLVVR